MNLTRRPALGWTLIIASSLLFGLNASTTKVLVHAGFDPTFLVPYRSSASAVLALVVVLVTNPKSLKVGFKELGTLALFGIVGLALLAWLVAAALLATLRGLGTGFTSRVALRIAGSAHTGNVSRPSAQP